MDEKLYYRIGLDIGIASVGWAVLQNNSQDEPVHIVDMGVHIFTKAEIPKTGESLAGPRRDARSARRRLRRRKHRLERMKCLFLQEGLISDMEQFYKRYESPNLPNVYQLRYEALDRKLKDEEFAQVLLYIAKHRGFRSTRKAETKEKENGAVLKATTENEKLMKEKGYRTVGEMIYCDVAFKTLCPWSDNGYILSPRNKAEDYRHTILRALLVDEVKQIFEAQRALGNEKATEQLEEKYLEIMQNQRSFDMGPGKQSDGSPSPYALDGFGNMVGNCTLEPEEKRAAKATYTAELFVALQKMNNLRVVTKAGEGRFLTEQERKQLIELLYTKRQITYTAVRKELNIENDYKFNSLNYSVKKSGTTEEERLKETEKAIFISMPWYHEYMKRMGTLVEGLSIEDRGELFDKIGTILTLYKNDDSRTSRLLELGLEQEDIDTLLELSPAKFQHVSQMAMKKIIPFLKEGLTYDKACTQAGYDFKADGTDKKSKLLKGQEITAIINDIANPVTRRAVSQTVKVINAIIQKYGSPQAINIELAREMSKDYIKRQEMDRQMKTRAGENDKIKKELQELGVVNPTGQDIVKYRLWQEQQGICLYSGRKIPLDRLFSKESGCDVDHILPYSITFDDSYRNKVLVYSQENRQKGNRTPYEYFGQDEEKWKLFEANVNRNIRDYKKQQKLFKHTITEEERREFKKRNLNDTSYITTVVYNMIRKKLEFEAYYNSQKKVHVMAVNGAITSYLRKRWGLSQKNRDMDYHHSVDAVIIACVTNGMIHRISRYMQARELRYAKGFQFVDEETGEIFDRNNFSREEWDNEFGVQIPRPWHAFKMELDVHLADDPKGYLEAHSDVAKEIDYPAWMYEDKDENGNRNMLQIHPMFISRMPNHKVTGAAHADTIRSPKYYKDGGDIFQKKGYVVSKTALTNLKLNKDGEISNYFNPESDILLYNAIKRQLKLYGNDPKKAFAEPFHKPKSDGTPGPIVKKVKIYDPLTKGIYVNNEQGIAGNKTGSMIRVDIFKVDGKYYGVPIYISDVVKKKLPNKAATAQKPYDEWKDVDDKDFIFSIYQNDLIRVVGKDKINVSRIDGTSETRKDVFAYFLGFNIANANISGESHCKDFSFGSQGIQRLTVFEKYQVDILGNKHLVKKEKRMTF